MPRISAAHERQVRDRIVRAATEVFSEKGFHRATIADVVARGGTFAATCSYVEHWLTKHHQHDDALVDVPRS